MLCYCDSQSAAALKQRAPLFLRCCRREARGRDAPPHNYGIMCFCECDTLFCDATARFAPAMRHFSASNAAESIS